MKKILAITLAALAMMPALYASPGRSSSYVNGTVVDVQKHKMYSPAYTMGGSNPSDAPLASLYYSFEVAVRVDCQTYVGRYETPFNYLPSEFTTNQPIQVRLTRHVLYFDMPNDPDMRMGIVRRSAGCGSSR